jgi:uncharacterized protein (DUF1684 family)
MTVQGFNELSPDSSGEYDAYAEEWRQWRSGWEAYVSRPHGWLSPVDLHFTDATHRRFDGLPGLWWQDGDSFFVDPDGSDFQYLGESFSSVRQFDFSGLEDDQRIVVGGLEVGVTYRETYMMVVYDPMAVRRSEFAGVPVYQPSSDWVLTGRYEPFSEPRLTTLDSVSGRFTKDRSSVGVVHLSFRGEEYSLQVVEAFGNTTVSFNDTTNGVTTFAQVRWIPVSLPEGGGSGAVVLDFNRALNLPCAFSDAFPICPVPLPTNRLPFAVEAGEKNPNGPLALTGPTTK